MNWLAGWSRRVKIEVDRTKVSSDLTDFPFMVKISTSSGLTSFDVSRVFTELGSDGNRKKIAVTSADGVSQCYVEIEKWDTAGQQAWLWVKGHLSSSQNTVFYLYYDSSQGDNTTYVGDTGDTPAQNVWNSSYLAVYHMSDGASSSETKDSTSNGRTGTKTGASNPSQVSGKVGNAQDFNGSSSKITFTNPTLPSDWEVQALVKIDTQTSVANTLNDGQSGGGGSSYVGGNGSANNKFGNQYGAWINANTSITTATWYWLSIAHNVSQNRWEYHHNGQPDGTPTTSGGTDKPTSLGAQGSRYYFDGQMCEIRISNARHSASWHSADYSSIFDQLVFFSIETPDNSGMHIEVDWDNDGNFTGAYDDVTLDVKDVIYSRGKSEEGGKAETGRLVITVKNVTGKYSPDNVSSPLYGLILPRRPIAVWAAVNGVRTYRYYGFIEEIVPHPHWQEQDAIITALDGMDFLARQDIDTVLHKNQLTGYLFGAILDAAGWSASKRAIDSGQDTVPYAYWSTVKARSAIQDLEDSENGFAYVNGSGNAAWEDRAHRSSATHQTSQATFTDTMVGITAPFSAKGVYNIVRCTITPWELQSIAELWRLEETPIIYVGGSTTYWANASAGGQSVFVDSWTSPAATTDYTANTASDGSGVDKTVDVSIVVTKFAKTMKIVITNNAAVDVYLTLLKARGTHYDDQTKVSRQAEDSSSQQSYQKRTLDRDGKFITNADRANDFVNWAIARYKDPQPELSVNILARDSNFLSQILAREISDRVTIVNTKLGISQDYFIDHLEHSITDNMKVHTVTWRLLRASNEDFWCLDFSTLGTGTKLGY